MELVIQINHTKPKYVLKNRKQALYYIFETSNHNTLLNLTPRLNQADSLPDVGRAQLLLFISYYYKHMNILF